VGKTEVALELAESLGAEIISADSRYLYRGLDIGTAKPARAELARVPHHLVDVTTPDEPWSLAQYQEAALAAIATTHARGRVPLLVGGTGQYVRAVTDGWQVPAGAPNPALRAELEAVLAAGGPAALAQRLAEVDPASAAVVDLRNPRRVIRALEVALTTGQSFVGQRGKSPPPFRPVWLGLTRPRAELYDRIDARIDGMVAAGLVNEVRGLAERGYGWDLPAMSAIGYRQVGEYLRGETSLEGAIRAIRRATRLFVRRQANWFKLTDPAIHWARAEAGVAPALAALARGRI
jgi:tRNA dimethylallyltransferase